MRPKIVKPNRPVRVKGIGRKVNRAIMRKADIRGGRVMENIAIMPVDKVIVVGKDFDKFVESHKEESKKAREMHHRRAIAIRKNRIN